MNYLEYLILEKVDIDEIYLKYYSNIKKEIFDKIVKADPTHIPGKRNGKYIQWLLKLYKKSNLKLEDLYKATEYLILFDKQSIRNRLDNKDIFNYSSLQDLFKVIKPFKDSTEIESKTDILNKTFVKEFKNFNMYIPKSYEDSCILGSGTEWCTATGKTKMYYDDYTKGKDDLYIFISKTNPKDKYQFYFAFEYERESEYFADIEDQPIDLYDFFINRGNEDIMNYFKFILIDDSFIITGDNPEVFLNDCNITSLKGIEKMYVDVIFLNINNNPIVDLSHITILKKLETLQADNCQIDSLKYISELKNLEMLSLAKNNIKNLDNVEKLTNLRMLNLGDNLKLNSFKGVEKLEKLENFYYYGAPNIPNELMHLNIDTIRNMFK